MSLAFVALIAGFLLGKSTSDQHHLRKTNEMNSELTFSEHCFDKLKNAMAKASQEHTSTKLLELYSDNFDVNSQLQNFTVCMESTTNASHYNLEEFLVLVFRKYEMCRPNYENFQRTNI